MAGEWMFSVRERGVELSMAPMQTLVNHFCCLNILYPTLNFFGSLQSDASQCHPFLYAVMPEVISSFAKCLIGSFIPKWRVLRDRFPLYN